MTEQERRAYINFMYDPRNAFRCAGCPENRDDPGSAVEHRLPCGQQNCWVICHCRHDD